ncbi:MAG: HAMP domain-containing protein [Pseudomonadota bacterium]
MLRLPGIPDELPAVELPRQRSSAENAWLGDHYTIRLVADLPATIAVTSNDEIGRLSRTFNVMIDVLRQREREKGRGHHDGKEDGADD